MRILGIIILMFIYCPCLAQQYLNLSVDNDLYFGSDRYYSSGVFISSGAEKRDFNRDDYFKKYVHWTLGQEIFTPSNRYSTDVESFDYPYGGWLFLERLEENYYSSNRAMNLSFKFGVTGRASLAPYLQNLYHKNVLGLREVSWEQAVPERIHLNINIIFRRRWDLSPRLAFLYEYFGTLGTQRINLGGSIGFLLGNLPILSFFESPIVNNKNGYAIYFGSSQEYRFHDFMISGSLFDSETPFDFDPVFLKNKFEIGVMVYISKYVFRSVVSSISQDTRLQKTKRHNYLNISISRKFNF